MKNKILSILFLSLIFSLGFAKPKHQKINEEVSRQCCSKTFYNSDGSSVTITACAGWIFSNNVNAMNRACAKVDQAAGIQ